MGHKGEEFYIAKLLGNWTSDTEVEEEEGGWVGVYKKYLDFPQCIILEVKK